MLPSSLEGLLSTGGGVDKEGGSHHCIPDPAASPTHQQKEDASGVGAGTPHALGH